MPTRSRFYRCTCSSRTHTCNNNVMGPPDSYSMWNQRSQTMPQFQVLVYDNRAGVAHDSLCAVPAKRRLPTIMMAKDQAHEQSNVILQTKGGAAGLYENHEALMLFMLAGPDCARMVEEFDAIHDPPPSSQVITRRSPACKQRSKRIYMYVYHLSWR